MVGAGRDEALRGQTKNGGTSTLKSRTYIAYMHLNFVIRGLRNKNVIP